MEDERALKSIMKDPYTDMDGSLATLGALYKKYLGTQLEFSS